MTRLIILCLFLVGCSNEVQSPAKTDMFKFTMKCKELTDNLKLDFIIEGTDEKPRCIIGQKDDVRGELKGYLFHSLDMIIGALRVIELKKDFPKK